MVAVIRYFATPVVSTLGCVPRCLECGAERHLVLFGHGTPFTTCGGEFVCLDCINKAIALVSGAEKRMSAER